MRTSPKINKTKKSCKKATTVPTVKQEQEEALLAITRSTATRATSGTKNRGRVTPTAKAAKNGVRKLRTKTPATAPASITLVGIDKGKEKEENLQEKVVPENHHQACLQIGPNMPVRVRVPRSRGAAGSGE